MAGDLLSPSRATSAEVLIEMDDTSVSRTSSIQRPSDEAEETPKRTAFAGVARHTLGLILLLCVVFTWTLSNFLGSVCVPLHSLERSVLT